MQRFFIHLAYNGTPYCGWQRQAQGRTVQQTLEQAFSMIIGESIRIVGAGRTDTGVHARSFYAHFDTEKDYPFEKRQKWVYQINAVLDKEIVVYHIFEVDSGWHARFSALSRTYQYHIHTYKNPFLRDFSYEVFKPLDIGLMNQAAAILCGKKDFTSFSKLHTQVKTNICHLYHAGCEKNAENRIVFTFTADRFLRNMVRAMVGTLLEVGEKKISVEAVKDIIEAKDRGRAGLSVPAAGLFLTDIKYF